MDSLISDLIPRIRGIQEDRKQVTRWLNGTILLSSYFSVILHILLNWTLLDFVVYQTLQSRILLSCNRDVSVQQNKNGKMALALLTTTIVWRSIFRICSQNYNKENLYQTLFIFYFTTNILLFYSITKSLCEIVMGESCRARECLNRMPNKQKTWLFLSFIIVLLLLAMLGLQNSFHVGRKF